jgi:hypothetical protein
MNFGMALAEAEFLLRSVHAVCDENAVSEPAEFREV